MVRQEPVQILQPIFERTFSDSSYGFRPGRNAHQAIERAKGYYEEGNTWVVDLDLEKYFDTVNHDLPIKMARETVKDEAVIGLIKKFLKSGIMADGIVSRKELGLKSAGTPQGGNLSPLLSNMYLTRFDLMPEERGHTFVRYADDCNIYVKSLSDDGRVCEVFGREVKTHGEPKEKRGREPCEIEVSGVQPVPEQRRCRDTGT
jgi:group II intron reverse transcriptase/maturase